jgi:glycosyltransferase involved in cell wall biosynthesis
VLVDTCNHESFIQDALASVLDQDIGRGSFEVLVVDDGSTDRTPSLVERFGSDVRLIRKSNGGQASAFNVGIPITTGRFVAFLDGDDRWVSNRLGAVVEVMEGDPSIGAVGNGLLELRGERVDRHVPERAVTLHLRTAQDVAPFLRHKSFLGASRFAARRELLEDIVPVPEALVIEADEYLFTLAAATAPVRVLPAALTHYRLHEGNLFQFDQADRERLGRKQRVLAALARDLPESLERLGLPADVVEAVVLPLVVDSERYRLTLSGGRRRETLRAERAGASVAALLGARQRRAVKMGALALAATLPPQRFYRLRDRYGRWLARG